MMHPQKMDVRDVEDTGVFFKKKGESIMITNGLPGMPASENGKELTQDNQLCFCEFPLITSVMSCCDYFTLSFCQPSVVSDGNIVKWIFHALVWIATIVCTHILIDPVAFQVDHSTTLVGGLMTDAAGVSKHTWTTPQVRELYLAAYVCLWAGFLTILLWNGLSLQRPVKHTLSMIIPLFLLGVHFTFMMINLCYMSGLLFVNFYPGANTPAVPTMEAYHLALAVQLLSLFGMIFISANLLYLAAGGEGKGQYPL